MTKCYLFFLIFLSIFTLTTLANGEFFTREQLEPIRPMTLGNEGNTFISKSIEDDRELPPEGIHSFQTGIALGDSTNTPVAYQEARHTVIAPNTIPEQPENPSAVWVCWESGADDDRQVYSKYYHSFYFFWDGPYQISQTQTDAGRPAMAVTDNGWIHCVYHGDHDESGQYQIGYANHTGETFTEWEWREIISNNEDEGVFPTITSEGNNVWVAYTRFWDTPEQELDLQHGIWDEETETMTWWSGEDIKTISQTESHWLYGSMFPDNQGNIHIAYSNSDNNLTYRVFDPAIDDFIAPEEVIDESPEDGPCYSPSLVVDSNDEVHITFPYTYWGSEAGNLGTANYIHGNSGNWSTPENLHYWQNTTIIDSFCTYPVIGIDNADHPYVTYTNLRGYEEPCNGYFQLYYGLRHSSEWEGEYLTSPEGEEYPYPLPGYFWYNGIPNHPSVPQKYPLELPPVSIIGERHSPPIVFGEYYSEGELHAVYLCRLFGDCAINDINYKQIPSIGKLHQNHPNPFNPNTTIDFEIPQDGAHLQGGLHLTLNIYDISGKLIKTLVDKPMEAGYHSVVWDGRDENGHDVASGVYFYKLNIREDIDIKQMLLVK